MKTWICIISNEKQHLLAELRLLSGLQMAYLDSEIWLKHIDTADIPHRALLSLQPQDIFVEEDGKLFPIGKSTPVRKLPQLLWQPVSQMIQVEVPTSALPAQLSAQLEIKLVQSQKMRTAEVLRLDGTSWRAYVETAPAVRLNALKFALSEQDEVLIMGRPLPTLPGDAYWQQGNLLMPLGWELTWQLFAAEIAKAIHSDPNQLILMETNGTYQLISKHAFQPAQRSAVRQSKP